MDDQDGGLIPKKTDSDRSNVFHMLPHTIEDICTRQSMSTSANNNIYVSPIRHVLPQIPTRSSTLRMAISKQTHREMVASVLGNKQESSIGLGRQLDLSARDRSAGANSDESQDQLSLDAGELIPSWKDSQRDDVEGQVQEREQDHNASFQHHRQDQQESSADSSITTSGFHSTSSSASSASNIDPYMMNPEHHHLDQHLPPFSPTNKEGEVHGKGHSSEYMQKISGINMGPRYDRNSPQMSSMPNFNPPQTPWHGFEFGKGGYNSQSNDVVALEQVVQKVNNPMNTVLQSQHPQVLPSTRSFESSPNPIKLKIRRDIGAIEQQQQQLHHSPHPLQQPPQITPPPSHMSHNRMMLSHQMPIDFQLHQQQKHLQHQQHSYMYESSRYVQSQGPKDYYLSGGSASENVNTSSSAIQKVSNLHYSQDEYQDPSAGHMSTYSPDQSLSGMSSYPSGQLQHAHHYHNQQQMMNQQLQHQHQYQHYQHHVAPPQTSSILSHRSSTPLSSAMMVLHGATPSPPIFNCPPQGQQASQLLQPAPSPSSVATRPKTGRAKTNAELKKQLMEKRAGQQVRASGDGSSLASSPSPSQIEVSSPRSVSSPHSDSSCVGGFQETPANFNGAEGQPPLQPNLGQYIELTKEEMEKSNLSWQPGDLVWARVTGHPLWPAMVIPDPGTQQFVKLAPRGQKSQFHMQFFGEDQERSWVIESSAISFTGRAAFHDFCQRKLQDNKKDRKMYKIPSQHKKSWEASVRSAEKAFTMSRLERFAHLATLFVPEYKTKRCARKQIEEADSNKRKSRSDRSSSSDKFAKRSRVESDLILAGGNMEKNDGDRSFRDDHHQSSESSHIVLPKNVSNQHQAQFTVFCRKKRDIIAQENPSWSAADIDAHLWQQWSQLDDETKSRFIPMGSDFTYLSRMMQNVDVGGETGVKSSAGGKLNGFAEISSPRTAASRNAKAEETRGRKKTSASSNASKNNTSKHDSCKADESLANSAIVDEVCFVCEKPDLNVVQCKGPCRGLFHRECIGQPSVHAKRHTPSVAPGPRPKGTGDAFSSSAPDDPHSKDSLEPSNELSDEEEIICPQCRSKTHKCCECGETLKLTEATTVLCSVTDCGRFYHRACVDVKFFKTPDKLVCPLHSCLTCRVRNKVKDSELILADEEDLDFYECIRCPAAFHIPGTCLATGSKYLAGPFVICSKHFTPTPKTHPLHARFGATWCFTCEKSGGHMLNCESCPAAHHPSCLKISTNPSDLDGWQCPDCIAGINPLHGDIVWVKFGSYRWWPAQIYWPYEVPQNIADLPHDVGEFPVCFFGSRDYLWLNRRRVFPFKAGDRCCREALKKSGGKVFDKAIREAVATYKALKSDPTSTVCATSNIIHLEKNISMSRHADNDVTADDVDNNDGDEEDDDGKKLRKRKKQKVVQLKEKQISRLSRRVKTKETTQVKIDSEKQPDATDESKHEHEDNLETGVTESSVTVKSPVMFLSPQIEKDLSEIRALLKMKKPVEPPLFGKKSLPNSSRSLRKSGRDRPSKNDSLLLSTSSSIVSTLINRPLLQSTSLPGVHDTVCSWCGLESQSSCESDLGEEEIMNDNNAGVAKCFEPDINKEGEAKETADTKCVSMVNAEDSEDLTNIKKDETASSTDDADDNKELVVSEEVSSPSKFEQNGMNAEHFASPKLEEMIKSEQNVTGDVEEDKPSEVSKDVNNQESIVDNGVKNEEEEEEEEEVTSEVQKSEVVEGEKAEASNREDNNNNNLKEEEGSACDISKKEETPDCKVESDLVKESESKQNDQDPNIQDGSSNEVPGKEGFRKRGRLIFCDKVKCSKVYHYKCLRLTKMPHGNWLCPLHQCTICGRASTHQCSKCPNAFCLEHFPHCLSYMDDGSPICTGHHEAPPISEELVADILDEMALTREAEMGHSTGSQSHRKSARHGDEMEDKVGVIVVKVKKRRRSFSVSSSSSSSSIEQKKKNSKQIKRRKPAETKDVSFEKRILPSRTQSRRFLDNNTDDEEEKVKRDVQRKDSESKGRVLTPVERRLVIKDISFKKDVKVKRGDEKVTNKEGKQRLSNEEKSEGSLESTKFLATAVGDQLKEGLQPGDPSKKIDDVKKLKPKKLEKIKKLKDSENKKKDEDGSPKVKKKKRPSSEGATSRDIISRHSSKEEQGGSTPRQQQQTLALLPVEASSDCSSQQTTRVATSPSQPLSLQETKPPVAMPSPVKPSSLLPPPSSPDKSPMFDNSDDEFPELVIDVPM